jgi:hypothetical protein
VVNPRSRIRSGGPFLVMTYVLAYPASQKEQMHSKWTLNNLFLRTRTRQLRNLCAESSRENSFVQTKRAQSRADLHKHCMRTMSTKWTLTNRLCDVRLPVSTKVIEEYLFVVVPQHS